MFVTVEALTHHIDNNIVYVLEAKKSRLQHSEATYSKYMEHMEATLKRQVEKLKSISTNKKLINSYTHKVENLFK